MSGKYDNILRLPHPTSAKHPRMPVSERAAIFSPFAALSGHAGAIAETARLTDQRIELDEDTRAELDRRDGAVGAHRRAARGDSHLVPAGRAEGRRGLCHNCRPSKKD